MEIDQELSAETGSGSRKDESPVEGVIQEENDVGLPDAACDLETGRACDQPQADGKDLQGGEVVLKAETEEDEKGLGAKGSLAAGRKSQ